MDTYTRFLSVLVICCMVHWCSSALLFICIGSTVSEYPVRSFVVDSRDDIWVKRTIVLDSVDDVLIIIALFVVGSAQESIIAETDR